MPTLNHTHQYIRVSFKNRRQYMCAHPDCSTIKLKQYLVGKRSMCNKCGGEFVLDSYALTVARPLCEDCRDVKTVNKAKKLDVNKIKELEVFKKI